MGTTRLVALLAVGTTRLVALLAVGTTRLVALLAVGTTRLVALLAVGTTRLVALLAVGTTRLVALLAAGTPALSPQLYGPLSAVHICPPYTHTRTHNTTRVQTTQWLMYGRQAFNTIKYKVRMLITSMAGKHNSIHLLVSDNNSIYGHFLSVQDMHINPRMPPLTVRRDGHYVAPVLLRCSVLICAHCC